MGDRRVWISLVAVALLAVYSQFKIVQVEHRLEESFRLPESLSQQTSKSLTAISSAGEVAIKSLQDTVTTDLGIAAKTVSDQQAVALEQRLRQLTAEVSKLEAEVSSAEGQRDHALLGLPEHVELDKLNEYYVELWKKNAYVVDTFSTALGQINFSKNDYSFAYLASSKRLASLKIGKKDSTENSELIKAWLNESERAKARFGYVRQFRRTRPSDYGETTETLYTKGDMYFKTLIQHQRVLETYGRHSLSYTYYVETGSDARRKQYELEQYNQKLGS